MRAAVETRYAPGDRARAVAEFARLHVPPAGALLRADGAEGPLGCGMRRTLSPGVAAVQRIFVEPAGGAMGWAGRSPAR